MTKEAYPKGKCQPLLSASSAEWSGGGFNPQNFTFMKYKIEISLAEDSKIVKTLISPYYMSNGKSDMVTFSSKSITIEAERGRAYTEDDIFKNVQNSLYNQTFKTLLYHYSVNGANAAITRIMVTITAQGKQSTLATREFTAAEQPLPVAAPQILLDPTSLELLMDETDDAYNLRLTMVHWLSAMAESDKKNRMECLWRAFERICIYRRHRNRDEIPYVSKALLGMVNEMKMNSARYPLAMSLASRMTYADLRRLMWHDLIMGTYKNRFDLTDNRERAKFKRKFVDDFISQFDDARVVALLFDTLTYMESELTAIGEYSNVEAALKSKISANVTRDADVLALMACHYAYFLRIRLFHGHSLVKCSIFDKQSDKMGVGVTAQILEALVAELINNFGRL